MVLRHFVSQGSVFACVCTEAKVGHVGASLICPSKHCTLHHFKWFHVMILLNNFLKSHRNWEVVELSGRLWECNSVFLCSTKYLKKKILCSSRHDKFLPYLQILVYPITPSAVLVVQRGLHVWDHAASLESYWRLCGLTQGQAQGCSLGGLWSFWLPLKYKGCLFTIFCFFEGRKSLSPDQWIGVRQPGFFPAF